MLPQITGFFASTNQTFGISNKTTGRPGDPVALWLWPWTAAAAAAALAITQLLMILQRREITCEHASACPGAFRVCVSLSTQTERAVALNSRLTFAVADCVKQGLEKEKQPLFYQKTKMLLVTFYVTAYLILKRDSYINNNKGKPTRQFVGLSVSRRLRLKGSCRCFFQGFICAAWNVSGRLYWWGTFTKDQCRSLSPQFRAVPQPWSLFLLFCSVFHTFDMFRWVHPVRQGWHGGFVLTTSG